MMYLFREHLKQEINDSLFNRFIVRMNRVRGCVFACKGSRSNKVHGALYYMKDYLNKHQKERW